MSPWIKRIAAALAIKEGVEWVQEKRQPKRSFAARISKPLTLAALGGGLAYLFKTGKLDPVVEQAKGMMGHSNGSSDFGSSQPDWDAPAATSGVTTTGATSTTTTV